MERTHLSWDVPDIRVNCRACGSISLELACSCCSLLYRRVYIHGPERQVEQDDSRFQVRISKFVFDKLNASHSASTKFPVVNAISMFIQPLTSLQDFASHWVPTFQTTALRSPFEITLDIIWLGAAVHAQHCLNHVF